MTDLRRRLLTLSRQEAERHFNPATLLCLIPRETAWYAITLLESGRPADRDLANRILTRLSVQDGTHSPCTLLMIYRRYLQILADSAQENVLKNLRENLLLSTQVRYSDGNVNHPIAAFVNLICTAELLNEPAYHAIGLQNLRAFQLTISGRRHQHHLQAEMAEYNSPTYSALTLWFLAMAAELAQDPQARDLALTLEQGLWINVAMHWHEPSQQFAGPFSRAYAEDSYGGYSALHCTMACAMDRQLFFEPRLPRQFHHPSALIQNAFPAILHFHVPDQARQIAFAKPLPYYFRMTTYGEQYHENGLRQENDRTIACFDDEVYPGGWSDLSTYLTDEYGLATAGRPYVNAGQSDGFTLRYRRAVEIKRLADFRSLYTRMVFNDSVIARENFCHVTGSWLAKDFLYEEGRLFGYQHENKALICYAPKRVGHRNFTALRLDLIFSAATDFDELYVDDIRVRTLPFTSPLVSKIVIADYNTYIAILPLSLTLLNGFTGRVSFRRETDHFIISLYNYRGEALTLEREQMSLINNGFACLVETRSRFPRIYDFNAFMQSVHVDELIKENGQRCVRLHTGDNELSFRCNPLTEQILERKWNGVEEEVFHLEIIGDRAAGVFAFPSTLYSTPATPR